MKYCLTIVFILLSLQSFAQVNCNMYEAGSACYKACQEAEMAIRHPQGSKESQQHFDTSIKLCPTFDYAYFEKAVPYLKRGQFVEWKKLIDKAVELKPEQHLGYRGWCRYQFLRDYKGAIEDIERLEAMASYDIGQSVNGDYHLTVAKALCYKALGEKEKAVRIIREQLADKEYVPMPYDYLHLGVLYLGLKKPEDALASFLKQLEINDYLAETYYYLGLANTTLGDKGKAEAYFQKALAFYEEGKHLRDPYTHHADRIFKADILAQLKGKQQ